MIERHVPNPLGHLETWKIEICLPLFYLNSIYIAPIFYPITNAPNLPPSHPKIYKSNILTTPTNEELPPSPKKDLLESKNVCYCISHKYWDIWTILECWVHKIDVGLEVGIYGEKNYVF